MLRIFLALKWATFSTSTLNAPPPRSELFILRQCSTTDFSVLMSPVTELRRLESTILLRSRSLAEMTARISSKASDMSSSETRVYLPASSLNASTFMSASFSSLSEAWSSMLSSASVLRLED